MTNHFFTEEKIGEIRERSNILDIVSDYIQLKKTGKNFMGLCPFHSEKTPSFMVNQEKKIFYCFGCGAGGDIFTFLMKMGHFSFPQAVEELAKRTGVRLPARELSPAQKKEIAKRDVLFKINQIAMEYFYNLLTRQREGEEGRKYLAQRGVSHEVIEEHRLGYSLEGWDGLVQHLRKKEVPLEMAGELGLIHSKERGGWYDVFRGRILFPIFDLHHRVVGFGGRIIKEGKPKYINSPESIIYHKGEILYGLQVAKQYIPDRDGVLIVEGYFDLLTIHQYGWKHSIATLGTALTPQHIRTLKRYTKNVMTVFDADQAGVQATLRSLPLFLEEEISGKVILLPQGDDPDGFLRKGNSKEFEKRMAEAMPLIDFFFDRLMKTYDVKTIDGKVKVAEEGVALIGKIANKIRKNFYLKMLAERLDLSETLLFEMLPSSSKDRPKVEEERKRPLIEKEAPKSEEMLISLMVHYPELIPTISKEGISEEFENAMLRKIAEALKTLYQRTGRLDVAEALGTLEENLKERLCEFSFREIGVEGENKEKILMDCIQKIREKKWKKERAELFKRIKEAEKEPLGKGLESLLIEHQKLIKRGMGNRNKMVFKKGEGGVNGETEKDQRD